MFAENNVKSTFFTLGWVAKRCPDVIKRIVDEGHELASHGLEHQRATTMSKAQLFDDIKQSKDILEDMYDISILFYSIDVGKYPNIIKSDDLTTFPVLRIYKKSEFIKEIYCYYDEIEQILKNIFN